MAKGGGAWKVAYADFVTAMMAFFLVMWICGQDQKMKQAIARYFVTPMGILETGSSTKPDQTGAIFPRASSGPVPEAEAVAMGSGRSSYTRSPDAAGSATKVVSDWILTTSADDYWREQVNKVSEWAVKSEGLLNDGSDPQQVAKLRLSRQLRDEISREVRDGKSNLSKDLVSHILSEVNWSEIAEDLIEHSAASNE